MITGTQSSGLAAGCEWQDGRVTGVVDWQSASIGPPSVDVGHCRGNLFGFGLEVADRFTTIWEGETGLRYNPWAKSVYDRLTSGQKTRKKKAIVAVARKLLVRCWVMLLRKEPWNQETLIAKSVAVAV